MVSGLFIRTFHRWSVITLKSLLNGSLFAPTREGIVFSKHKAGTCTVRPHPTSQGRVHNFGWHFNEIHVNPKQQYYQRYLQIRPNNGKVSEFRCICFVPSESLVFVSKS